ncbi:MAG TPA: hypothetical protein VJR89_10580 [Polyangiales bacterium]|nr:hypothetical protein [Polyangiales bacterium]
MRRVTLIVALSCFACATSTLDYTATRQPPRALQARAADQVEVFMEAPPERAHVEVGIVEAQQEPGSTEQGPELVEKMRGLAGQHGCDALANFTNNDSVTETMLAPGGASRKYTLSGYRASCIVYTGSAPSAPVQVQAPAPVQAPVCAPNATQLCYGPGGCRGGQSCTAGGQGWTVCDCGTASPPAAAAD